MDRFYAGAPSCTPTRATVMTGRTNDRTGAARVGHSINKQEKMLLTAFRDAGFSTAHFGKWHLNAVETPHHPMPADDPHNPGALGFDYFLSATNQFNLYPDIAARMREQLDAWSTSVDRSMTGADYPEGKVLPSGREPGGS